jgi:diaminohydroxyphosphoribosylaminopyrimidine deaminase/5-amino-6-(5-phosphoribosylamino)uracil reductase
MANANNIKVDKKEDMVFMKRAIELAKKAQGRTSPNPMVGAVIVGREGNVVAEGYHKKAGSLHAEAEALKRVKSEAEGATLYVNLEPCCIWGRTPPCVDAIIESGIRRVVIGIKDPNPKVSGRSIRKLKKHKISVSVGVLEKEAEKLNEVFFTNMRKKRPFVVAKCAQTLDGKIATKTYSSFWVTGKKAREYAKKLRGIYDAVLN